MKVKKMFNKIKKRQSNQKRHTHRTAAGIEDAMAALMDVERELETLSIRVGQAMEILKSVRVGPHAYDPDRPAGLRINIKRKF